MDKLLENAQNIGMLLAGVAIAYLTCRNELKKYLNKQKTKVSDNLPRQSTIDNKIVDRLEHVKELLNADIIHIYEFHNGEHYADGRSALKFSCTYEVVRAGVDTIRKKCMQIPIACMPKFIKHILDENKICCKDIEEFKDEDPATYNFKKELNMKSFADYAIKNKDNKVVGFVAVIWNDTKRYNNQEEEIKKLVYFIEENLINSIQEEK